MRLSRKKQPPEISAYIGAGLKLEGELVFSGRIRFEGELSGRIRGESIVVGDTGVLKGEIQAEEVVCFGKLEGIIRVRHLDLRSTGFVRGEIFTERLTVEEGARIEGTIKVEEGQIPVSGGVPEAP